MYIYIYLYLYIYIYIYIYANTPVHDRPCAKENRANCYCTLEPLRVSE